MGYSPWGHKESDMTWRLNNKQQLLGYQTRACVTRPRAGCPVSTHYGWADGASFSSSSLCPCCDIIIISTKHQGTYYVLNPGCQESTYQTSSCH